MQQCALQALLAWTPCDGSQWASEMNAMKCIEFCLVSLSDRAHKQTHIEPITDRFNYTSFLLLLLYSWLGISVPFRPTRESSIQLPIIVSFTLMDQIIWPFCFFHACVMECCVMMCVYVRSRADQRWRWNVHFISFFLYFNDVFTANCMANVSIWWIRLQMWIVCTFWVVNTFSSSFRSHGMYVLNVVVFFVAKK